MNRANTAELRKSLELSNMLTKIGIAFVPIPYTTEAERQALVKVLDDTMEKICKAAEAEEEAEADERLLKGWLVK